MWREMDELLGDPFAEQWARRARPQPGFSPRVDVYYCGDEPPRRRQGGARRGRHRHGLARGRRPRAGDHRRAPGGRDRGARLPAGRDRGRAVSARGRARRRRGRGARPRRATRTGSCRVELPLAGQVTRRVPIDTEVADGTTAIQVVEARRGRARRSASARRPAPRGAAGAAAEGRGRLSRHADPARGRPGALDEAGRRRARRRAHAGAGRVARPRARRARARAALRRRRGRGRRADAQGPRRDDADPRAGHRPGAARATTSPSSRTWSRGSKHCPTTSRTRRSSRH